MDSTNRADTSNGPEKQLVRDVWCQESTPFVSIIYTSYIARQAWGSCSCIIRHVIGRLFFHFETDRPTNQPTSVSVFARPLFSGSSISSLLLLYALPVPFSRPFGAGRASYSRTYGASLPKHSSLWKIQGLQPSSRHTRTEVWLRHPAVVTAISYAPQKLKTTHRDRIWVQNESFPPPRCAS